VEDSDLSFILALMVMQLTACGICAGAVLRPQNDSQISFLH
jgi:hypothetical protein